MFIPKTIRNIRYVQHIQRGPDYTLRVVQQAVQAGPNFVMAQAILIRYGMTSVETVCATAPE